MVTSYLRKSSKGKPLSQRTGKRAAARALKIAKQRVDQFGYADLYYTSEFLHFRDEVGKTIIRNINDVPVDRNPFMFCGCVMADIGRALIRDTMTLADPLCRAEIKQRFLRDLRQLRRPFYYARETERRRLLARERRKIKNRTTTAPEPTPAEILAAWEMRKTSKSAMIRLGGLLVNLSCYVDSALRYDENGNIIGRNAGIRGWLADNLPELHGKYKTLMRYKEMAEKLRQATETHDPKPTAALLAHPHPIVTEILSDEDNTFVSILRTLSLYLDPKRSLELEPRKPPAQISRAAP